jgi:BirA family biotin operon repressor/biotin-[acetyl-CoA-carboxylase] ligase
MSGTDRLSAEHLRAALGLVTIGSDIIVLPVAESTNDVVCELAKNDRAEGLVVFAEQQTAGRGQRANVWESAPFKGLWLSILLKPAIDLSDSARLTTWAAQTVASMIGAVCEVSATVKPPNDVYIDSQKVAGVLVEMRARPRAPHFAVLGIGINVNQSVSDFPEELRTKATSLAIVTGRQYDRNELAVALLRELDRTYRQEFVRADPQH